MNYVDSLNMFGVEAKEIPSIKGNGAPTAATAAAVGCFYMDIDTGKVYKCTAAADGVYTWEEFGAGGAIPFFDLAALGMSAIPPAGGQAQLTTDTTEMLEALNKGPAVFGIPFDMGGVTMTANCTLTALSVEDMAICVFFTSLDGEYIGILQIYDGGCGAVVIPFAQYMSQYSGVPTVSADDNGKFLRVVNGAWAAVAVQNVAEVGM